jgi:hypothetical protein
VPASSNRGRLGLWLAATLLGVGVLLTSAAHGAGAAAASKHAKKCKKGQKRVNGKCRPKPKKVSRFGAMIVDAADQARLDRFRALGTHRIRFVARLDVEPNARIGDAQAQGFEVLTTAANGAFPAAPPTDLADYQARLGRELAAHPTPLVSIENEPTAERYYTGTPAEYLAELAAAVPVAHAHGSKVSDGGLVSTGVQLATWYDLWTRSGCAAADHYAAVGLPGSRTGPGLIADLPSCADPNHPILGSTPKARQVMDDTLALIAGFRSIPIDYVNFHWYQSTPEAMRITVEYLRRATGKQVITNEIGQFDDSPDTVRALLDTTAELHLPWVVWFASDGTGAVGMFNADNSIRPNGLAFRDFVQRCDGRINCGRDKRKKHGKKHHKR